VPLVDTGVKPIPVGLLFVTQPMSVAVKVLITVVTLVLVTTAVTGADLHSAIVIIIGLVPLMHHSLLVDLDLLRVWLTAGLVVDVGMYLMARVARAV